MKVILKLQLNPTSLRYLKPEDLTTEKVLAYASFNTMQFLDYIQLGTIEIDVELETADVVGKAVSALRVRQADIRAKATKEATELEHLAQQLLCLENGVIDATDP